MKPILLIGEVCDDVHVYGHCRRLNPEAPTPVLSFETEEKTLGMSGNVCANLHSLSGRNRIDVKHITNPETITKTRFVDKKHGYILLRVDQDVKLERLYDGTEAALVKEITNQIYNALVVSDYDKGFLTHYSLETLASAAKQAGVPSVIDTKKAYGPWANDFDFVKINNLEYQNNDWTEYYGKGRIIVTEGEKGASLYDKTGCIAHFKTEPKQVVNVSGAGDTFLAGLVVSILSGFNLESSIQYANKAAGVAVIHSGVVAVNDFDVNFKE